MSYRIVTKTWWNSIVKSTQAKKRISLGAFLGASGGVYYTASNPPPEKKAKYYLGATLIGTIGGIIAASL